MELKYPAHEDRSEIASFNRTFMELKCVYSGEQSCGLEF